MVERAGACLRSAQFRSRRCGFHYGQEIFEGIKGYRHSDGSVWTFRPEKNAARLNRSAYRMALPQLPEETFIESLKQLVQADEKWVPSGEESVFTSVRL